MKEIRKMICNDRKHILAKHILRLMAIMGLGGYILPSNASKGNSTKLITDSAYNGKHIVSCPKCNRDDMIAEIRYGLYRQGFSDSLRKEKNPTIVLGGCVVSPEKYYCRRCCYSFVDDQFIELMFDYLEKAITAHSQRNEKVLAEFWSVPIRLWNGCANPHRKLSTIWDTTLRNQFRHSKVFKVDVEDYFVSVHPFIKSIYGLTLKLCLTIDNTSDRGYMFMVWDFRDSGTSRIPVRTWQPEYINKENGIKLNPDDVYTLADFDL